MPAPKAHSDIITKRREIVASARLRGLSLREIRVSLENQGVINPKTGKSYNLATIHLDLVALTEEWQKSASRSISELKAQKLAELAEVKRTAWYRKITTPDGNIINAPDLKIVLAAIERECKILGLDATKEFNEYQEFLTVIFAWVENAPDETKHQFKTFIQSLPG